MMIDPEDLQNRFQYHPANTTERQDAHEGIRNACLHLAFQLNVAMPDGREKSLAITNLEQVMFWANAGVARMSERS